MILLLQSKRNKTKLQREQFLALIIALIGVVCISLPGMHQQLTFIWSIACLVILVGELFYGIGSIHSKEILSDLPKVSPFLINGIQMFYGGLFLLISSTFIEQPNLDILTSWSVQWPILYLIFVGSIVYIIGSCQRPIQYSHQLGCMYLHQLLLLQDTYF